MHVLPTAQMAGGSLRMISGFAHVDPISVDALIDKPFGLLPPCFPSLGVRMVKNRQRVGGGAH